MKKLFVPLLASLSALMLLTSCVGLSVGGGTTTHAQCPTLGQQLIDLRKAKDAGIITDAEYQSQRAKLLGSK
jgi:hypothetical protein